MWCSSLICLCLPAIMAAEERRKKREQMKILKQQVCIFPCMQGTVELLLKFLKEVAILQNGAPSSSAYTHCTIPHTPCPPPTHPISSHPAPTLPPLYNMHDLTVNSFDLALILLPGEDQAHSANSYGERTPCTADSRGSS